MSRCAYQQQALRAPRANRVFGTDEKHISPENTVIYKTGDSAGVSYKITDCVRTDLSSAQAKAPQPDMFADVGEVPLSARAPLRRILTGIKAALCLYAYISSLLEAISKLGVIPKPEAEESAFCLIQQQIPRSTRSDHG